MYESIYSSHQNADMNAFNGRKIRTYKIHTCTGYSKLVYDVIKFVRLKTCVITNNASFKNNCS